MNQRTSGRTRARACRKRERRAAHGETRVLPSRCTSVALISSSGSGGGGDGGGDGGGGGGSGGAATAAIRIYVRFVIDGVAQKGVDDCGGRIPLSRASRGVSLCARRRQVKEAVADLSINDRLEPRLLKDLEPFCIHLYLYLSPKKVSNYTTCIIIAKYLQLVNKTILQMT